MAVNWRIPGVACVLLSFLSVRWMLKTDELDPCPCRCMSSVTIRNRAPLDSIPLAAARTEEETMLAVPATPGSMRRPLVCPPVCVRARVCVCECGFFLPCSPFRV
jgi:hypothetical protein